MTQKYKYQKRYKKRHPEKIAEGKKKYYGKTAYAINHHQRFTDEEIQLIKDHEISDTELSKKIGRSVQAIQIKRSRLNQKRR